MSANRPRIRSGGTDATELFRDVTSGRPHTAAAWLDYVERFHSAIPNVTETLFENLWTATGLTSYGVLARAALEAGGSSILDVGCGEGALFREMLEFRSTEMRLCGIDFCAAEVERGRRMFSNEGRVTLVRAFADALPFQDGSFDTVVSQQTFNFLPDPRPALAEAFRVIKPGGYLVAAINRGWKPHERDCTWIYLHDAVRDAFVNKYPRFTFPKMEDRRIYRDEGIPEILAESAPFDLDTLTIEHFSVGRSISPEHVGAIFNRLYVFASAPDSESLWESVEARARELAVRDRSDTVTVEIPFRLIRVRKKPTV